MFKELFTNITSIAKRELALDVHKSEILSKTMMSAAYKIAGMSISYLFIFILSNTYGAEAVGIYTLALSIVLMASLVGTLGYNQAIVRYSAQYSSLQQWDILRVIYNKMAVSAGVFAVILSSALAISGDRLSTSLFKEAGLESLLYVICAIIPFAVLLNINTDLIQGLKRIKQSEYFRSLSIPLLNLAFFAMVLVMGGYFKTAPVISYGVAVFVTLLISFRLVARYLSRSGVVSYDSGNVMGLAEILKTSLPLLMVMLAFAVMEQAGVLLLGYYKGIDHVGIYSIANRLSLIVSFILAATNTIVAPKMAEFYWNKNMRELSRTVKFSARLVLILTAPILAVLMIVPESVLGLFGGDFRAGSTALRILCVGQFVNAYCGSVGYLLIMTGNQHVIRNIMMLAVGINVSLNVVLIPVAGIHGAALASAISTIFWNVTALIISRRKLAVGSI